MYLPDLVALHRNYLDHYLEVFLIPYTESHFRCFNEVEYPLDLTTVEGVWKDPLPNFANLIVLDLNLKSAIYWLIPIISAVRKAGPLRRIIIREIDDDTPWTFNWRELDLKLANLPFVYLIIVYPTHSVAKLLPTLLPLTDHSQRLCLEDSTGMIDLLAGSSFLLTFFIDEDLNYYDPECDPVGRNSIFRKLSLPENEVVQVKPELKRKRE